MFVSCETGVFSVMLMVTNGVSNSGALSFSSSTTTWTNTVDSRGGTPWSCAITNNVIVSFTFGASASLSSAWTTFNSPVSVSIVKLSFLQERKHESTLSMSMHPLTVYRLNTF